MSHQEKTTTYTSAPKVKICKITQKDAERPESRLIFLSYFYCITNTHPYIVHIAENLAFHSITNCFEICLIAYFYITTMHSSV